MSEQRCYRNHCPNEAVARITLIGGRVLDTMTVDLCLTHYYEALQAVVGMPITAGAIPREEHDSLNSLKLQGIDKQDGAVLADTTHLATEA